MFLKVDFPQTQKNIYYLILVLVFWTAYTAFNIPYYSFGSVLSDVDSERVRLAAFREVLGYVGIFCASSVPTFIVGRLLEHGLDNGQSWAAAGVISAVISVSTILIMWRCTRGKEPVAVSYTHLLAGHSFAHFPHPTHLSESILALIPLQIAIAFNRHTLTQQPQATQ